VLSIGAELLLEASQHARLGGTELAVDTFNLASLVLEEFNAKKNAHGGNLFYSPWHIGRRCLLRPD
jgi:hypothetical protein